MDAAGQRQLAVDTFNRVWELLELPDRTPEQVDEIEGQIAELELDA